MNTLGQNIRNARLAAHMSQEKLAEAVLVSSGAISHYENDRYRPQHDTLEMIARVLEVSVEELYKSDAPVRTGKVTWDVFDDLDKEEAKLLRRIWKTIKDYVRNGP